VRSLGAPLKNVDGEAKFVAWIYGNWSLPNPRPQATFRTAWYGEKGDS